MKHIYIASGIAAAVILIGGAAFAQTAAFTTQMGVGAQSSSVTSLQTWLTQNGYYSGPITGYYGSLTRAAVENFQTAHSISATGYVGPLTLAALNANESVTSTSGNASEIAQLQAELNSLLAQIQAIESGSATTGVPAGSSMTLQTNENSSINGSLTASGMSPFTYSLSSNPSNGVVTSFNSATGAFTYMPNSNFSGNDTFTYTVGNSAGTSAAMTVTIVVGNSTGAPTGQALSFTTSNGVAYNGTLSASGNSPYTFSITSEPSHGTISNLNTSNGSFTYVPSVNYTGSDSFTYTVSNSAGVSSPVTVTVTNGSSSGAPTGQSQSLTTTNGATINGTLAGTGSGTLTYTIVVDPVNGTLNIFNPTTGAFSYTPHSGYRGSDSFSYTVSNSMGVSSSYTVSITSS